MSDTRDSSAITPKAAIVIGICTLSAVTLWSFGIRETIALLAGGDATAWSKALAFAAFIVFGDLVGTKISDVPRHTLRQILERAVVTAAAGLILAINARALIAGVNLFVPKVGVWSLDNLLRAFLMYVLGAVFVSVGYSLFIPGHFARKAARQNQPEKAAEVLPKYTLRRQVIKTWNGIKGRWFIVLANYWYMNLLPWGWLTAEVGFGIVSCGINIYTAYKSTCKDLDAPFARGLLARLSGGPAAAAAPLAEALSRQPDPPSDK